MNKHKLSEWEPYDDQLDSHWLRIRPLLKCLSSHIDQLIYRTEGECRSNIPGVYAYREQALVSMACLGTGAVGEQEKEGQEEMS